MTSQPGQQIITMHILSNISRSESNQIMNFGQFIFGQLTREIFFFKNHAENETRPSRSLWVFKKTLYEVNASGLQLSFNIFWYSSAWTYNKNKLYKTLEYSFRDMLNFDFLQIGLRIVSPPHFVYDFCGVSYAMFY